MSAWRLVPMEPSDEMLSAGGRKTDDFYTEKGPYPRTKAVYRAMLAASPSPPPVDAAEIERLHGFSVANPDEILSTLRTMQAKLDEAELALEPFANCVEQIAADESDEEWAKFRLLVSDYRRAASALTSIRSDKTKGEE